MGSYEPLRRQLARSIAAAVVEAVPSDDLAAVAWAMPTDREVLAEIIRALAALVRYTHPVTTNEGDTHE